MKVHIGDRVVGEVTYVSGGDDGYWTVGMRIDDEDVYRELRDRGERKMTITARVNVWPHAHRTAVPPHHRTIEAEVDAPDPVEVLRVDITPV